MRLMIACVAAALVGAAPLGGAATAKETPQAGAPSARQMALTRRYIELLMSDQFETMIRHFITEEASTEAAFREMPEEDRQFLVSLATELTTDMVPQMITEMVPVYAAVYTEAELEALVAFYDTEMGRSISRKTVQVMPEADRAVMSVLPQMLNKMASRMCQHYECSPDEMEQVRRDMFEGAGLAVPAK